MCDAFASRNGSDALVLDRLLRDLPPRDVEMSRASAQAVVAGAVSLSVALTQHLHGGPET